ncbi:hypothetical protein ACFTUC_17300 [Streptomyces sp. NPDC056944]|uniref:hypothetical protein n=1 Tax=Streptomyces sp. NPDC056944 TaxID=3345972 RepID=UPI00362C17E1
MSRDVVDVLSKAVRGGGEVISLKAKGPQQESDWVRISRADFGRLLGLFEGQDDDEGDEDESNVAYDAWAYLSTHKAVIRKALVAYQAEAEDPSAGFVLSELDHVMGS